MADRGRDTRTALLEAGVELLRELTPVALVAAMRTREIARRAGVSPPAFFHHFHTVEDYAEALVARVFSTDGPDLGAVVTRGLREAQRLGLPAEQSIAYHTRDLQQAVGDPDLRVRTGLWALGGPAVDDAYRAFLRDVDRQLIPQAQALHRVWGREVRPPLDLQSYLAVQLAILNGAAIRHIAEPSVMTPERYARAAAALSVVLLRPNGDRRTMDDRLAEMNWYATSRPASTSGTRRSSTRLRILDAAAELFDEYGYAAASVARIARAADVHTATLYDHFETKAHLALALFDSRASGRFPEAASLDAADPVLRLRGHLEQVTRFVAAHSDLARIYFAFVGCGDIPADHEDVLGRTTVDLVGACLADVPSVWSAEQATEHLLIVIIGAVLRHPGDSATPVIDAALQFLPGAA